MTESQSDAHTLDCRASGIGDRTPPEAEPPPQAQPAAHPTPDPHGSILQFTWYANRKCIIAISERDSERPTPDGREWAVGLGFRTNPAVEPLAVSFLISFFCYELDIIIKRGRERSGTAMSVEPERGTVLASREVDRVAEPSASRSRSRGAQLRAVPRHDTTHKPSRAPKGQEG